ncbi:hypothetical protein AB0758_49140 [Tolypothrix bouteillei VB521301_2]|uniref:hypothetical protein n=1 Tax=Tolypothrix bouteillei TaxID=1246981 RepID=UPI0005143425
MKIPIWGISSLLAASATSGLMLLLSEQTAVACSCALVKEKEYFQRADVVFTGTVIERYSSKTEANVWIFTVDKVLKGDAIGEQDVSSPKMSSLCGAYFEMNARYQVYATNVDGRLETILCSGNRELPKKAASQ